jgi:PPOX class probable F420-dependent enzyme
VRLDRFTCSSRLAEAEFGVLGTVDAERGVHLVPVVFAVVGDRLAIPIDAVKAKSTTRLRRTVNLDGDSRASLLVDHRSDDWQQLWWVRADLRASPPGDEPWREMLAERYPPYHSPEAIIDVMTFDIVAVAGWTAS